MYNMPQPLDYGNQTTSHDNGRPATQALKDWLSRQLVHANWQRSGADRPATSAADDRSPEGNMVEHQPNMHTWYPDHWRQALDGTWGPVGTWNTNSDRPPIGIPMGTPTTPDQERPLAAAAERRLPSPQTQMPQVNLPTTVTKPQTPQPTWGAPGQQSGYDLDPGFSRHSTNTNKMGNSPTAWTPSADPKRDAELKLNKSYLGRAAQRRLPRGNTR